MRIAGIDYGEKRIGIALSDPMQIFASPLELAFAKPTLEETAKMLWNILSKHQPIKKIVLGLPLMMSGKESAGSEKVRQLAKFLEEISKCEIVLWDERLTSAQVEKTLREIGMKRKKRADKVDLMAACTILQSFLDSPCNK